MSLSSIARFVVKSAAFGFLAMSAVINLPVILLASFNYSSPDRTPEIVSNFLAYDSVGLGSIKGEMDQQFRKRVADRFSPGMKEKKLVSWLSFNQFRPNEYAARTGDIYTASRAIPRPFWFDTCHSTATIEWQSSDEEIITMVRGSVTTSCNSF